MRVLDILPYQKEQLPIPKENISLTNGRLLAYRGPLTTSEPEIVVDSAVYSGPGNLIVIVSLENTPNHGRLLHASLSYPSRDPSWNEIKAVRYTFYPKWMDVMMVLPDEADYVNFHKHCFQMWQCPEKWGLR